MYRYLRDKAKLDLQAAFRDPSFATGYHDREFGRTVAWDIPLLAGYPWLEVATVGFGNRGLSRGRLARGLPSLLRRARPDALWLHGYDNPVAVQFLRMAKKLGIPVMVRAEVQDASAFGGPNVRRLKDLTLERLFRHIDAFLAIGSRNAQFYRRRGVPERRIFHVPYAVDNSRFGEAARGSTTTGRAIRSNLDIPDAAPVLLFVGKLIAKKRPADVLRALSKVKRARPAAYALFVGDGALRSELEDEALRLGIGSQVRFVGFQNQTELPGYYATSDLLVIPSELEPWGLVVNEAMNFGLGILASSAVGAVPDLVVDGRNGYVFPVGSVDALADYLGALVSDPSRMADFGRESRRLVSAWDFEADARGVRAALKFLGVSHG